MMLPPDPLTVLADVREQGGFFLFQDRRDVHVGIGGKSLRLAAAVHFEKIELWPPRKDHASADRAQARDLVVHVSVDRPVREDDIRTVGSEQLLQLINARP